MSDQYKPTEENLLTKVGHISMLKKKQENEKYAETVRHKEMYEWRNRRKIIHSRPTYRFVAPMLIQSEFTKSAADTAYMKRRTLNKIGVKPLQEKAFYDTKRQNEFFTRLPASIK